MERVSVFAPIDKAPEDRINTPPIVTFPHIETALSIVRLFNVTGGKLAVPAPPIIILEVAPPVRVPQFIWPLSDKVFAPIDKPPAVELKVPLTVSELCKVTILVFVNERPFRATTLVGIKTPDVVPPNTRLDEAVVAKFDGVPAIVGPLKVRVFAPTENVPLVRVRVLLIVTGFARATPEGLLIMIPPVLLNVAENSIPVV